MAEGIKDKVAIVGMGCTKFGERWDMGVEDLLVEAAYEAFQDAGIQPKDIILEVNKVKIASMKDYARELSKRKSKDSILFLVKRGRTTFYVAIR